MSQFKLLITGFAPFGGAAVNPAWEAVRLLAPEIGKFTVHKLQIPTVFGLAAQTVLEAAQALQPNVILCVGQAGGRAAITPERIGINVRDARIPDNQGNQPRGQFIDPDGPAAYFATVDVTAMAEAAEQAGIPATVSNSAGAFVCNDTLYTLLHRFAGTDTRVGFVHVPYLPEQAGPGVPSMALEKIAAGLTAAIESL
jgi:pyroglutamyl-peptidase